MRVPHPRATGLLCQCEVIATAGGWAGRRGLERTGNPRGGMFLVSPLPPRSHGPAPFFLPVDFLRYILKFQATWPGQQCLLLGQWGLWLGPGQHVGVCAGVQA